MYTKRIMLLLLLCLGVSNIYGMVKSDEEEESSLLSPAALEGAITPVTSSNVVSVSDLYLNIINTLENPKQIFDLGYDVGKTEGKGEGLKEALKVTTIN